MQNIQITSKAKSQISKHLSQNNQTVTEAEPQKIAAKKDKSQS
jgi:hypothetical protein